MGNLAGKTFEVQVGDGTRWVVQQVFDSRSAAETLAETLLDAGKHRLVRILSESEQTGVEVILEEESLHFTEKPITVVALDEAAPCESLADFYGYPARRTLGRLMRQYLDEYGMTAGELLFNATHLRLIERNTTLSTQAVQRIATVQARDMGIQAHERVEFLYGQVADIQAAAKADAAGWAAAAEVLKRTGLKAYVAEVESGAPAGERPRRRLGGLAAYLNDAADWNGKLELLVHLARKDLDESALTVLDEAAAEILDGSAAVLEIMGGHADAAEACRTIIHLSHGRHRAPEQLRSCVNDFNDVMARLDLPLTRGVLLERVAAVIGGTHALTREGREVDRAAFITLVRELTDTAGLIGGPVVAEAVTQRSRILLSPDDEDLSVEDGIARILERMPHRAGRLGYLLDLAQSGLAEAHEAVVLSMLARVVQQLTSLASLVPKGSDMETTMAVINGLKTRLAMGGISEEWQASINAALDKLVAKGAAELEKPKPTTYTYDEDTKAMLAEMPERKTFTPGEIIFEEGDAGDQAYLVQSGTVEIFRQVGNGEEIMATLGRGEIIGEMSLIDKQPRMASARVVEEAELTIISQENLGVRLDKLRHTDRVMRRLIDTFVSRLRGEARIAE